MSSRITTGSYLFSWFNRSGAQVLQRDRNSFPASTDLELKYYNRFVSLSPLQQIWSSSITTGSYLFPCFNRSGAQVLQQVRISFTASTDMELKYYNRFVSLSPLQQIWSSSITTGSYLFPCFNRSGAQVLQQVRISFTASTDLELKYYNRFLSLSPLQQIWSSSITTGSYPFPRFNRSAAQVLQQVPISFPASTDLELKYYNRSVSLFPLQQIWSSSITTGSYLFTRFNRYGAQVLQQVRISFPASIDLELKYYNRFVSLSPLQQIWSSSITTGSYLFPSFNRSGAQVLQQVRISFPASTDLELKYYNRFVSHSALQKILSSSITTGSFLFPRFNRSGAQVFQQVRILYPASTDLELKYYNRFISLSPLQQIWSSSITTGSYLFPRLNRSGAHILQQVRISFPASTDLELKYFNRFLSLSPLQQIWSSSITTGSYLFPRFNRSGAQV